MPYIFFILWIACIVGCSKRSAKPMLTVGYMVGIFVLCFVIVMVGLHFVDPSRDPEKLGEFMGSTGTIPGMLASSLFGLIYSRPKPKQANAEPPSSSGS